VSWAGTLYTHFRGLLPPCKIHFASKFCAILYWQRCCTAPEQLTSAKLCDVVQGMELRNFCSSSFSSEGAACIPRAAITLNIGPYSSFTCSATAAASSWIYIAPWRTTSVQWLVIYHSANTGIGRQFRSKRCHQKHCFNRVNNVWKSVLTGASPYLTGELTVLYRLPLRGKPP